MDTKSGVMDKKYIAVAIDREGTWIKLSKPCSKLEAEALRGTELRGETFTVKTEQEIEEHLKRLENES